MKNGLGVKVETLLGSLACLATRGNRERESDTRVSLCSLSKSELNQGRWQLKENFDELQSWPWVFGQTPEFTHRVSLHDASELGMHDQHGWGPFSVEMHSKEGIVLNAKLVEARFDDARVESEVRRVVMGLQGKRYDELALPPPWRPSSPSTASVEVTESVEGTLLHWLRTVL